MEERKSREVTLKINVVGEKATGKSSLIASLKTKEDADGSQCFEEKILNNTFTFVFFENMLDANPLDFVSYLLVYDCTVRESFEVLEERFLKTIFKQRGVSNQSCFFLLLATKADLAQKRTVSKEEAEDWAKARGFKFLEVDTGNSEDVALVTKMIRVNANFVFRKRMTKIMLQETTSAVLQRLAAHEEIANKLQSNEAPAGKANSKRGTLTQEELGLSLVERQKRKLIKLFSSSFTVDNDPKATQRLPEEILGIYSKRAKESEARPHSNSTLVRKKTAKR